MKNSAKDNNNSRLDEENNDRVGGIVIRWVAAHENTLVGHPGYGLLSETPKPGSLNNLKQYIVKIESN